MDSMPSAVAEHVSIFFFMDKECMEYVCAFCEYIAASCEVYYSCRILFVYTGDYINTNSCYVF